MYGIGFQYGWEYANHYMDRKIDEARDADKDRLLGSPYPAAYGSVGAEIGMIFSMLKNDHPQAFEAVLATINNFK